MEPYLAPAFGALVLLGLGVLIQQLREISTKLSTHGEKLVVLVEDVRSLKEWRDQIQDDERRAIRRKSDL